MLLVKDNFINKVLDELGYFEEESKWPFHQNF
jgi:hypothetical protein